MDSETIRSPEKVKEFHFISEETIAGWYCAIFDMYPALNGDSMERVAVTTLFIVNENGHATRRRHAAIYTVRDGMPVYRSMETAPIPWIKPLTCKEDCTRVLQHLGYRQHVNVSMLRDELNQLVGKLDTNRLEDLIRLATTMAKQY
jgi:hypothetical protein